MSPETMRAVVDARANGSTPGEIAEQFGLKISAVRTVRTCANPECGELFTARSRDHCKPACRSAMWRAANNDARTVRVRAVLAAIDRLAEYATGDDWLVVKAYIAQTVRAPNPNPDTEEGQES